MHGAHGRVRSHQPVEDRPSMKVRPEAGDVSADKNQVHLSLPLDDSVDVAFRPVQVGHEQDSCHDRALPARFTDCAWPSTGFEPRAH
jgi:hypothetical protein